MAFLSKMSKSETHTNLLWLESNLILFSGQRVA